MAYSDFTFELIEDKFGVANIVTPLFTSIEPISPSDGFRDTLSEIDSYDSQVKKQNQKLLYSLY